MHFLLGDLLFPINPERVQVAAGARLQSYQVIELGEMVLPRGRLSTRVTFSSFFPGAARHGSGIVKAWQDPTLLVARLLDWKATGERLRFIVTGTPINLDVHVDRFEYSPKGGHGDVDYTLALVESRELLIATDAEVEATGGDPKTEPPPGETRTDPGPPATYEVVAGDSLWTIARKVYGDGGRWTEVYEANKATIGSNPDLIVAGTTLVIPGGTDAGEPAPPGRPRATGATATGGGLGDLATER